MIQIALFLIGVVLIAAELLVLIFGIVLGIFIAVWWLPLAVALSLLLVIFHLLLASIKPTLASVGIAVVIVSATAAGTVLGVGALLAEGVVEADRIETELRELMAQSRGIEVTDAGGQPIGVMSAAYRGTQSEVPYLTVPIAADDVPQVFWACTKYLEDRGIGESWHILGVDFYRLVRAVVSNFISHRVGASTLAEMVQRTIRNRIPNPKLGWRTELVRKIASWRELPAITLRLFPDEQSLKAATATYLTLMTGAPQSRFGGEVHGVVLAARVLGKRPDELTVAEQALLAASIKRPLRVGGEPGRSWLRAKERADFCLAHAPLGDGFDRDAARRQLQALQPPAGKVRHPAASVQDRIGGRVGALTRELSQNLGADWWRKAARVSIAVRAPSAQLETDVIAAASSIEARQAQRLWLPLWAGDSAARIYGIVVDASGEILATASNSELDLGTASLPIGSVGKIVAALVLGNVSTANASAISAFAKSHGPAIAARLKSVPASDIAAMFRALGWHDMPDERPARRHAVYGAVEVPPANVLRGLVAINDLLWGERRQDVSLAGLVQEIVTVDGRTVTPPRPTLPLEPLQTLLNERARAYARAVLAAPLRSGTMRDVGRALKQLGATEAWAKSGTADVKPGGQGVSPTRALWHVGGFSISGHRLTFLLVAVSPTATRPLGFVQSPMLAPMTVALLKHAAHQLQAEDN